jgi:hypothetical protein
MRGDRRSHFDLVHRSMRLIHFLEPGTELSDTAGQFMSSIERSMFCSHRPAFATVALHLERRQTERPRDPLSIDR